MAANANWLESLLRSLSVPISVSGSGPSYSDYNTITITLGSLANAAYRQSDYVDNSTLLYADALVGGYVRTGAVAPTAGTTISIYCYALVAEPGGTPVYTAGASGTDSAYTADGEELQFGLLRAVQVDADTDTPYIFGPVSVCEALGIRVLPKRWGIVVANGTGQTMDATDGDHVIGYYGVR